ncbi:MAG: hypothetical protein J0L92_27870 [Deltaproteobacteria bacterium]|nr:hypothetical protein [Deltaproteobacteria bacterium]
MRADEFAHVTVRSLAALALATSLASCINVDPPEGVLACTPATAAADCPDGWFCRDTFCYRTPGDGADAGLDGGVPSDAFDSNDARREDAPGLDAPGLDAPGTDAFVDDDAFSAIDAPVPDAFVPPDAYSECTRNEDCNDSDLCTADVCADNVCTNTRITCTDGFSCTIDACAPDTGCTYPPNPMAPCPMGRTCDPSGTGMDGMPADPMGCIDADDCTTGAMCDDGLYCTIDSCSVGACVNAGRMCGDDGNPCTLPAFCDEDMDRCNEPYDPSSLSEPSHCGTASGTCSVCTTTGANTVPTCAMGVCGVACRPNFYNIDRDGSNGCEYECVFSSARDDADASGTDTNCDGADGIVGSTEYIYVSPTGLSMGEGDSPAAAVTVEHAFALATTRTGLGVVVSMLLQRGSYAITRALDAPNRLTMWGGYDSLFRSRSASPRTLVTSTDERALLVSGAITVDSVDFTTSDQAGTGAYTRTVSISGSPSAVFRNLTITAGSGGPGAPGGSGTNRTGMTTSAMSGSAGTPGTGGAGGGAVGAPSSGGTGAPSGSLAGPGTAASVTGSGCGMPGGGRGIGAALTCACLDNFAATSSGGGGIVGCAGGVGSHGAGASGVGSVSASGWTPAIGGLGGDGVPGGAGSGGGGAGGATCVTGSSAGAGQVAAGGGGGQGGAGGPGGGGGGQGAGGGASFAIFAVGSTLTLTNVTLTTRTGGAGGMGGSGGTGGNGQTGGASGPGQMVSFSCSGGPGRLRAGSGGPGGTGGRGGNGGCGGGGAGGPSIGLVGVGTTVVSGATITYNPGTGGSPGPECSAGGGNRGGTGVVMNQLLL